MNRNQQFAKEMEELLRRFGGNMRDRDLQQIAGIRDKRKFYQILDDMKAEGMVILERDHRVKLVDASEKQTAVIVSLSRGFAFARLEDSEETQDLFIHGSNLSGALLGDRVEVLPVMDDPRGPSGRVLKILEKKEQRTTGTVVRDGVYFALRADCAIRYDISIMDRELLGAKEGDKVMAELYTRPGRDRLYAKVVKIYGKGSSAKVCADAILEQNNIPARFPEEVLAEAEKIGSTPISEEDLKGRLDLRDIAIFTIDSASAKDLDDAISVSRTRSGGYKLGVHIADVSHYIKEGTALDEEAISRGTSVYFADRVVPMLPEALSNGVCSLNAGEDKLTFSAIIHLDGEGNMEKYEFRKSVIRSKVRGVYSEVNEIFDKTASKELREKYAPVIRGLNAARELANLLKERAKERGNMDLESVEPYFTLDENGVCIDVQPRVNGEAEQMIEQLMVCANQAAAKLAQDKGVPFVYRIHGQPEQRRVDSLVELLDALGISAKEIRKGEPQAKDFAVILDRVKDTPAQRVVSHQLLRTMDKARYSTEPIGHFGLALADYSHFTSPIRRYPDTAIHRILSALAAGEKPEEITRHYAAFAQTAAEESSRLEVRAMTAERSAEDCYMAEYIRGHIGERFVGIISGVTQRGVFVQLPSSVEGFVPIDSFEGCRFTFDGMITQYDELSRRKLTIGQELAIRVAAADVASGRIDFLPAEEE